MKIFFDLDGTLIDASKRHHGVYTDVVTELGGSPLQQSEYWDLKRSKSDWEIILPKSNISADQKNLFLARFIPKIEAIDYLKSDTLFPGAVDTIEKLSQKHTCYLVSLRRNHEHLLAEIGWLNLTPHFSKILSGHSETDGSDVKSAIIKAELGDNKGLIIGDTEADILTGKLLNLTTVAVLSGIRNREFLESLKPDYLLKDVTELSVTI